MTTKPSVCGIGILAMGGWYVMPEERNLLSAFYRALESGLGIVVPVRDYAGHLVIAESVPDNDSPLFEEFLQDRPFWPGPPATLALHVHADGLAPLIHRALRKIEGVSPIVCGMSVVDTDAYLDGFTPIFVRQSEHERTPAFYECAEGVWLDGFERDWYDERLIIQHLRADKHVTIVSPEIHGRDQNIVWEMLARLQHKVGDLAPRLQLCTALPDDARTFFGV